MMTAIYCLSEDDVASVEVRGLTEFFDGVDVGQRRVGVVNIVEIVRWRWVFMYPKTLTVGGAA